MNTPITIFSVVVIEHQTTHERRTVDIEAILSPTLISVRWPLQGVYDINLKTNTMRARSPQARRKHPYCLWAVADINHVRRQVWEHFNPDHLEREEAYKRHQEWIVQAGVKKCPTNSPSATRRRKL